MSLERDIKDAFGRHEDDARPGTRSLDRIESRIGRAHRRRLLATTAAGVAMLAAAVVVVPRVLPSEPQGFAGPSDAPVDMTATPEMVEMKVFRNERDAYQVSIPKDWYVGRFEGNAELLPPNQMGRTAGDDGFSIELQHRIGESFDDAEQGYTFEPAEEIGGRETLRAERRDDGAREIVYRVDWTGAGCAKDALCDAEIAFLRISILGTTQDLWERYDAEADSTVRMLYALQDAPEPRGWVTTLYGMVDASGDQVCGADGCAPAVYDEATQFVVRFMDARVEGTGAESFLTQDAADQYDARSGTVRLYTCCRPETPWQSYVVVQRHAADANSYLYLVELVSRDSDGNEVVRHEELGVGRGGAGWEIRFSEIRNK